MTDNDKEELIYTAVTECRERADQQTSVDDDDVTAADRVICQLHLARNSTVLDQPDNA